MVEDVEYVNGDAYISSRELKESMICDFCGNETRTHIRVPSLNTYLWWCESCQMVPPGGWSILTPETAYYEFPEQTMSHKEILTKGINHYMKSGLSYQTSFRLAVGDLRRIVRKRKRFALNLEVIENVDVETDEYDHIQTISMDINVVINRLVANLNDIQRKVLALSVEKQRLDELLTEDSRNILFEDMDTKEIVDYSRTEQLEFLGLEHSTTGNYYRRKKEVAVVGKKVLKECGFSRHV